MIPLQYVLIAVVSCLGTCPAFRTECNCICDRKDLCESVRSMKTAVDLNVNHLRQWTRHSNFVQRIHERWDDEVESVVRHQWEVRLNETRGLLNSCLASQKEAEKSIQKISLSMETLEKQVNDNLTAIMRNVENLLETFKKEFANVSKQHITDKKEDLLETTCEEPQPPKHGSVKLHGELKVGSIATYSCDPDRKLHGATTTKCLNSGKWIFDAPDCLSTCTVSFIEDGEIGRYETRHTRWSSHEEFKKVVEGSIVDSGETLFFRCKGDFLPLEGSQFVTSNRLEVTCNDGTWSKDLQCKSTRCTGPPPPSENANAVVQSREHGYGIYYTCKFKNSVKIPGNVTCHFGSWIGIPSKCLNPEEDRSISSLEPRVTSSTTEIPTNINLETVTRDSSGLIPNKDCSCTYEHEDLSVNAQTGNKILKFGDEIKIGEKVSFQCKYARTFLKFQNGLKLLSTANMTCTACKKWRREDVPTCDDVSEPEQSDSLIGFEENLNILPGGKTSIQQGVIHRFSCNNNRKQPEWHYGQRKGVSVTKVSVTRSGRLNIYITYLNIQKEATELNGEYECYIFDDQSNRKSTFLHLQVTDSKCSIGDLSQTVPENVVPDISEDVEDHVTIGSVVRLKCDDNEVMTGEREAQCEKEGKWKLGSFQCVPGCVLDLDPSSHLLVQPMKNSYRIGELVLLSCPPGQEMSSKVERLMCVFGGWSDPLPECKEKSGRH